MMDYLFMIVVVILWAYFPAFYGWSHGQTLTPMLWSAWGWICGQIALAGAIYIDGLFQ